MEKSISANLATLFSLVERNIRLEDSDLPIGGVTIGIRRGETYTLRGDAYILLHDTAEALAGPASGSGGPSLEAAVSLILATCGRFLEGGEKKAMEWLDSRLQTPPPRWTVIRPTTLFQRDDEIVIGQCSFRRGLPPDVGEVNDHVRAAFPAFSVSVVVEARDQEAAALLAELRIAEALSVVQLSDRRRVNLLGRATIWVKDDGAVIFSPFPPAGASLDHLVVSGGRLRPYFEPLSEVLVKADSARTEWERRTLAAARWLAKSLSTPWPSDSLVSQMVALEALFGPRGKRAPKGPRIARAIGNRWVLRSMTKAQQTAWIEGLYDRRNETVHHAGSFDDELEVGRLGDLTWKSVSWAASHLSPYHRSDSRPCMTQDEALVCLSE